MKKIFSLFCLIALFQALQAQNTSELPTEEEQEAPAKRVVGTFKANRILMSQSVKTVKKGELNFVVMHNFGAINTGFKEFFGLDGANTALNFDYGITDNFNVGIGRSTYQKTFQGYLKFLALRQTSNFPFTLSVFSALYVHTMDWPSGVDGLTNMHRLSYNTQLLLARKFTPKLSVQFTPTYIHKNLVKLEADKNDIFILMVGARYKITRRFILASEYAYVLPGQISSDYVNYFGVGVNIDTGGHVFQLRLSNASSLYEPDFLTTSQSQWLDGDIHFGFTINRMFGF